MNKFKVGDKVRCINLEMADEYTPDDNWGIKSGLVIGRVYTVKSCLLSWLRVGLDYSVSCKHFELANETYAYKPHVHCELIRAWADGAEVDRYCTDLYEWQPVLYPTWRVHDDYRIRPNKTDKELQIEKLEEQAKQLASDITKLKETL